MATKQEMSLAERGVGAEPDGVLSRRREQSWRLPRRLFSYQARSISEFATLSQALLCYRLTLEASCVWRIGVVQKPGLNPGATERRAQISKLTAEN